MRDKPAIGRRAFLEKMGAGTLGAVSAASIAECALAAAEEKKEWEQTSDRKIRIGVVGGGFGAGFQWHQHPNCIVEAVSDLQPARRDRLMKVYGCEKSYESLEKLILDPDNDAVAVFTETGRDVGAIS